MVRKAKDPPRSSAIGVRRRAAAWCTLAVGLAGLTAVLNTWPSSVSLESTLLLYLALVVGVAALGGVLPGIAAAVTADLLVNYYFVPPYRTLRIDDRDHVVALIVFVGVAVIVSVLVEVAGRGREAAARLQTESELLARYSASPIGTVSVASLLEEIRMAFGLASVELQTSDSGGWRTVGLAGSPSEEDTGRVFEIDPRFRLLIADPGHFAADQVALRRMAATAVRALEEQRLTQDAEDARRLAELDRTRSALLAAVGHDLRTPLSGIKAAVSSLRQSDVAWSDEQREELLETIEVSADRLSALVSNLLDATRIQAGAVVAAPEPIALDEVVYSSLSAIPVGDVDVSVPVSLPLVIADPVLLERVLVNLIDNAVRFRTPGTKVELRGQAEGADVALSVIDHAIGVPTNVTDRLFAPFERAGDQVPGGIGLGLFIVKGFCDAMGIAIDSQPTEGGGLTMTLRLAVVR